MVVDGDKGRGYVLVVDADDRDRELLCRALRQVTHVWVAGSSDEARAVLTENRVDLVVCRERLGGEPAATLLGEVAEKQPQVGRFLLAADPGDQALESPGGVVDRLFLPHCSPMRVRNAVLAHLRRRNCAARPRVLVADDSAEVRGYVTRLLRERAIETVEAADGVRAIEVIASTPLDAALVDLTMPRLDGTKVLEYARSRVPDLPILILTAREYSLGLSFIDAGALDYMTKPFNEAELVMRVERAIMDREQAREHERLLLELETNKPGQEIVAESAAMKAVLQRARNVAKHDVTVLVTGETGTGKEVVARYIHQHSRRAAGPFIPVNCGALAETLAESELFGHERGAFTNATSTKVGIFEAANGGTVFLDEVGELSTQSQIRLLRVLENREVTRVGSALPVTVDVRVVAASLRDLRGMVAKGRFRRDLFYRLDGFRVEVPPLKARPEDIEPLMRFAVGRFCARNGLPVVAITPAVLEQACSHDWPGNVRELLHVVERTLIARAPAQLEALDIDTAEAAESGAATRIDFDLPMREALGPIFADFERRYLHRMLELCGGHLGRTAERAGIHRKSLYNKLRQYGMSAADEGD